MNAEGGGQAQDVHGGHVYALASRYRQLVQAIVDGLTWMVCITGATLLRYGFRTGGSLVDRLALITGIAVVLQAGLGWVTELYRSTWRVGSFEQVQALAKTVVATTVVVTAVSLVRSEHVVPASAAIGGGALTLVVASALRSFWRLNWERQRVLTNPAERAIVFGAGDAGSQLIDALVSDTSSGLLPVGLLDDDPGKRNHRVRRLRVTGTRHGMAALAARVRADTLIIALPRAGSDLIRDLSDLALAAGLTVKVLPPMSQMLGTGVRAGDVRPVTEADLLGRRVVDTGMASVAGYLTGRRVLVTGAGGSIGSELCRQIRCHAPATLVMLDRDESGLHQLQLALQGRALLDDRSLVVCDIRDERALAAVFAEHRPEVVFHAAALKHLPLLEMWPEEAVKTNVLGTGNVLAAAAAAGVERFVNISTDKAAHPISVLGYSKRVAERITASVAEQAGGSYLSVRFGNVLGSRGSVLTTFRAQIARGGPVTVTHPDVTRYFMTVEEAVQLVVQAGAVGRSGEVLVLDMGRPVRILDVARRMVADAGVDIDIAFTGLRPGEKMHEQLWDDGEPDVRPVHPLISHVGVLPLHPAAAASALSGPAATLVARLRDLCQVPPPVRVEAVPALATGG